MSNPDRRIPPSEPDRELYRCSCGESDWRACYDVPADQGIDLYLDADGNPEEGEYHGDEDTGDDAGPNLMYICQACQRMVNLDGTDYLWGGEGTQTIDEEAPDNA